LFAWSNRSSTPNALSKLNITAANSRVSRETLWPTTLDLECDKAARIVKSFCSDGYLPSAEDDALTTSDVSDSNEPIKLTRKIPKKVLQNAAAIAVFTCMRSGLWMTGSGGSGILIARKSDGTWSPPSGIMLHTPTLSFIIGVDVYDCVLVISNLAALESITRSRVILGEDVGLASGPSVTLDSDEKDVKWTEIDNSVLSYVKSRGQLQHVNLNGCILTERANENARFYSGDVSQMDILAGNVARHVEETKPLFEVIKMAEGRTDFETPVITRLALTPAPGDAVIATPFSTPSTPRTAFGQVNAEDPDPFGVLALEMAGLEIREAGSRLRPASSQLELHSAPISPAHSKFSRQSMDTFATRSNRGSYMSSRTTRSTDAGTQTETGNTSETSPSPAQSEAGCDRRSFEQIPEDREVEIDYTKVDLTPLKHLNESNPTLEISQPIILETLVNNPVNDKPQTVVPEVERAPSPKPKEEKGEEPKIEASEHLDDADDEEDDDDLDDDEEPVIFEVASVQTASTQAVASRVVHAKGNVVTIPKRIPPPLPTRSPARMSQQSTRSELGPEFMALRSPLHQSFSESDLHNEESTTDMQTSIAAKGDVKQTGAESDHDVNLKGDNASLSTESFHSLDNTDNSDSAPGTKHTSFIYTGATEDRWSCDGSALTTPTTYSANDDMAGEDTPKREAPASTRSSLSRERQLEEDAVSKTSVMA
jgi:lipid-binding SYLF domain-containing protein